jgi:hypothetical protein
MEINRDSSPYDIMKNRIEQGNYVNHRPYPSHKSPNNKKELREAVTTYNTEMMRLREKFKLDLEHEYRFENHPKKDILWKLAWEEGHSGGHLEVLGYYDTMAELLTI